MKRLIPAAATELLSPGGYAGGAAAWPRRLNGRLDKEAR